MDAPKSIDLKGLWRAQPNVALAKTLGGMAPGEGVAGSGRQGLSAPGHPDILPTDRPYLARKRRTRWDAAALGAPPVIGTPE